MLHIGIDPGVNGGIVFRDDSRVVCMAAMPKTDADVFALLTEHQTRVPFCRAMIERVHSSPQMGVVSAFTFGRGVGALHMALHAAYIPFDEVSPRTWQKAMGVIYPKDSTQTQRKNLAKARAQQLFPTEHITHATADALLLAEYCRLTWHSRNRPESTGATDGQTTTVRP